MSKPQENSPSKSDEVVESKIPKSLKDFTLRLRAIRNCATDHLRIAGDELQAWVQTATEQETITVTTKANPKDGTLAQILVFKHVGVLEEFQVLSNSPRSEILSQSLLIFGFSTFDAFLGQLLRQLYREVPKLISSIEDKSLKIGELMLYESIESAVDAVIDRDISSLLRNSYTEQFSTLENRHGIKTLKKFANWGKFIEASQRRNLITHCNGIVNSQYLEICRAEGANLEPAIVSGKKLKVSQDYLLSALNLLYEVGLKLTHILWRKAAPNNTRQSEKMLTDELFDLLIREDLELAKIVGEFAITMPKPTNDLQIKISRINYAQALKWSGDDKGAESVLDVDWSGSIRDLRLGVEVLRENYDDAADLMRKIGKIGELVLEEGYKKWPVFREFRKTEQFKAAFYEIYGTEYVSVDMLQPNDLNEQNSDDTSVQDIADSQNTLQNTPQNAGETSMPSEQPSLTLPPLKDSSKSRSRKARKA